MELEEGTTFFFAPRGLKNLVLVDEMESLAPVMSCQVQIVKLRVGNLFEQSVMYTVVLMKIWFSWTCSSVVDNVFTLH